MRECLSGLRSSLMDRQTDRQTDRHTISAVHTISALFALLLGSLGWLDLEELVVGVELHAYVGGKHLVAVTVVAGPARRVAHEEALRHIVRNACEPA
jgi:hypothetical protein